MESILILMEWNLFLNNRYYLELTLSLTCKRPHGVVPWGGGGGGGGGSKSRTSYYFYICF